MVGFVFEKIIIIGYDQYEQLQIKEGFRNENYARNTGSNPILNFRLQEYSSKQNYHVTTLPFGTDK